MPKQDIATLTFYGATETVTGSKFLLSVGEDTHVLVDCGLFQGYKELRLRNWQPLPIGARNIDAVLLTHARVHWLSGPCGTLRSVCIWCTESRRPAPPCRPLSQRLRERFGWKVEVARYGQEVELS